MSASSGSIDAVEDDLFDFWFCAKNLGNLLHFDANVRDVGASEGFDLTSDIANAMHDPNVGLSYIDSTPPNLGASRLSATNIIFTCHVLLSVTP